MGGGDKDVWDNGYKGSEGHWPVFLAICDKEEHSIVPAISTQLFWLLSDLPVPPQNPGLRG